MGIGELSDEDDEEDDEEKAVAPVAVEAFLACAWECWEDMNGAATFWRTSRREELRP